MSHFFLLRRRDSGAVVIGDVPAGALTVGTDPLTIGASPVTIG